MEDFLLDFRDYLHDQDKSANTIKSYLTDLRVFSAWFSAKNGEQMRPERLTPIDIIGYRHAMLEEGKKPSTINRCLISISNLCQWAQEDNRIPSNPAQNVRAVAEEPLGPRALDRKEQLALMRAARKEGSIRDLAILTVLLHTGLRVGELCNLRLNHITIHENSGVLIIEEGKGTKRRRVPLNPTVTAVLKDYLKSNEAGSVGVVTDNVGNKTRQHLFYGQKGMPLTDRGIRHMINKYAYMSKIRHLSPHVLRHTCAKNLIDTGVSLDKVSKILGHANVNTTSIYTTPTERDLENAMTGISWE